MDAERKSYTEVVHAGGGTGLLLVQLAAIIPGLLPTLALLGLFTAVLLAPFLALALVAAVLGAPVAGVWLLVKRRRTHP